MDLRLSTKTEYGLQALIDLSVQGQGKPVQVVEVARRQNIPRESLAILMVDLRRAGLVTSVRGPSGGYLLTKDPADISLRAIIEALEGNQDRALRRKASRHWAGNAVNETWNGCLKIFLEVLEQTTLANLIDQKTVTNPLRLSQSADPNSDLPEGYAFTI